MSFGMDTILVVTEEWEPYNYSVGDSVGGLSTDVVRATFRRAGLHPQIRVYPWARAYDMALKDSSLCIYSIYRSKQRDSLFHWIGPINPPADYYLYKLASRTDIVIKNLSEAKRYKVGVMRTDASHNILKEAGFEDGKHLDLVSSEELNIKKLLAGRVDLIPGAKLSLAARMKKQGTPFERVEKALLFFKGDARSYMAFSKKTPPDLVFRVQSAFEQLKKEGIIDSITENYITTK